MINEYIIKKNWSHSIIKKERTKRDRSEKQKHGESNDKNWGRPTISENSRKSQLLFDTNNNGSWNSV